METRTHWASLLMAVVYVALLVGLLATLLEARRQLLIADGASQQASWDNWRREAQRQQIGTGPVSRRTPASPEPPTLVLLRDHFVTSAIVLAVLTSAVYFALAGMIRGAIVGPRFKPDSK